VADAFRFGLTVDEVYELSSIDPWFLAEVEDLVATEKTVVGRQLEGIGAAELYQLKRKGFSDARLADLLGPGKTTCAPIDCVSMCGRCSGVWTPARLSFPRPLPTCIPPTRRNVRRHPATRRKIMVLGGGPNRIGQGIEFDYCCVHAALAMREDGFETIMVNCNPETVSTDYDTSDRLYFEPVTLEDVLAIVHVEQPEGVIVQFGGQTPLKLVEQLEREGVPIIGTSPDAIDRAEDRERFQGLLNTLGLRQPSNRTAVDEATGIAGAREIGYPIVVRPSYVLGGRAMEIVYNEEELKRYLREAVVVSNRSPVLLDCFLDQAVEMDVDAVSDGRDVVIGAIMQHIEQAGVHSGDSACSLPPYKLSAPLQDRIREQVKAMALELGVVGLMNVQLAVQEDDIFVLEVNPRASRTVPFVSKSIGVSLAKVAARCMAGVSLQDQGFTREIIPGHVNVKESVFPFAKFPGVDPILGPEMKSTGEVMGVGDSFGEAFAKASLGAGVMLPQSGRAFLSVKESDKAGVVALGADLAALGFRLVATRGTARCLAEAGIEVQTVNKVAQGRPHVVDLLKNEQIDLIVNTTEGHQSIRDSSAIRRLALLNKVCYTTTLTGGEAFCIAIRYSRENQEIKVRRLQDLYQQSTS
jgi:carbamoyl-phosphate synthase large subunit